MCESVGERLGMQPSEKAMNMELAQASPVPQQKPALLMQLYYCKACGRWADKALRDSIEQAAQSFQDGMIRAFGGTPAVRETLPELSCPDGHGEMTLVKATDRIAIIEESEKP